MVRNELAFYNRTDAMQVASLLLDNGYVVMLSEEEELTILNYEDGEYQSHLERSVADRNAVVFMSRENFDRDYVSAELLEKYEDENETD